MEIENVEVVISKVVIVGVITESKILKGDEAFTVVVTCIRRRTLMVYFRVSSFPRRISNIEFYNRVFFKEANRGDTYL